MARQLRTETHIAATPERVWRALEPNEPTHVERREMIITTIERGAWLLHAARGQTDDPQFITAVAVAQQIADDVARAHGPLIGGRVQKAIGRLAATIEAMKPGRPRRGEFKVSASHKLKELLDAIGLESSPNTRRQAKRRAKRK